MPETPLLYNIHNLKYRYNDKFILDIPEISISRSSSTGFAGSNGCGKSTLLRIFSFLQKPDQGEIYFKGKPVNGKSSIRHDVTLLLQEPYLLKRSVFENIAFGLKARREKDIRSRVFEAMEWVGLSPEKFAGRRWYQLSGGEAHRVSLASRLVLRPEVLILDEPTASIDQLSAALIKEAIAIVRNKYNTSLIIASHDLVWLNSTADNILRMYDGRIVGEGAENLIQGPWRHDSDKLWARDLSGGYKIYVTEPPHDNAVAILDPSDIMISVHQPSGISAQNVLHGRINSMTAAGEAGKVRLEILVSGMILSCNVTQHAVNTLHILPGMDVWAIFKASSLHWQ